jgi:hypothetical protein
MAAQLLALKHFAVLGILATFKFQPGPIGTTN